MSMVDKLRDWIENVASIILVGYLIYVIVDSFTDDNLEEVIRSRYDRIRKQYENEMKLQHYTQYMIWEAEDIIRNV